MSILYQDNLSPLIPLSLQGEGERLYRRNFVSANLPFTYFRRGDGYRKRG
jgi:hypothetical protein